MRDRHRCNVACSRARQKLIIIGNKEQINRGYGGPWIEIFGYILKPTQPKSVPKDVGNASRDKKPAPVTQMTVEEAYKALETSVPILRTYLSRLPSSSSSSPSSSSSSAVTVPDSAKTAFASAESRAAAAIKRILIGCLGDKPSRLERAQLFLTISEEMTDTLWCSERVREIIAHAFDIGQKKHKQFLAFEHKRLLEYVFACANNDKEAQNAVFVRVEKGPALNPSAVMRQQQKRCSFF